MTQVPQVSVEYDSEYDILYLIVGDPAISEAEGLMRGVYIRRNMLTDQITGAIIEGYSKKCKECLYEILPIGLGNYLPIV